MYNSDYTYDLTYRKVNSTLYISILYISLHHTALYIPELLYNSTYYLFMHSPTIYIYINPMVPFITSFVQEYLITCRVQNSAKCKDLREQTADWNTLLLLTSFILVYPMHSFLHGFLPAGIAQITIFSCDCWCERVRGDGSQIVGFQTPNTEGMSCCHGCS